MVTTVLAYILAFVTIPIVALVVGIPMNLIGGRFLHRSNNLLFYWVYGIVTNWIMAGLVFLAASSVFHLFDRHFGWLPITLLVIGFITNDLSRINQYKNTRASGIEKCNMIGDILGIASGILVIFDIVSVGMMGLIIAGPIALFVYMCIISTTKSFPFWDRVTEIPDDAYTWFMNEPEWIIVEHSHDLHSHQQTRGMCGPFKLFVPCIGRVVTLYCEHDAIEESQARFIREHNKANAAN